ncbi:hypothetical protein RRG08_025533 [Elysia crispata]|uniref:Uncharacterized protein n=1 Tax=Elysia crispata TaxID=231223 RepID=A0AAE1ACA9_9GAST|nr:hypothetical protein RRG08_025533 [Elysia crispata]
MLERCKVVKCLGYHVLPIARTPGGVALWYLFCLCPNCSGFRPFPSIVLLSLTQSHVQDEWMPAHNNLTHYLVSLAGERYSVESRYSLVLFFSSVDLVTLG